MDGGQGSGWCCKSVGRTLTSISVPTGVICLFTVPLLYRQHQVSVTGSVPAKHGWSVCPTPTSIARVPLTAVPTRDGKINWCFFP